MWSRSCGVRSRLEILLAVLAALAPLTVAAQPDAPLVVAGDVPTRPEVEKALEKVADDPNLATVRTVNMLRWKAPEPVTDEPSWWKWANALARWFRGLFEWVAESGRLLVWVLGGLAAALLALFIARVIRERGPPRVAKQFVAPSHVRDLDIRPESLPDDVGGAALALWERGEQRAALALLYRGTLSRLVHVHTVPIRASSTEGECLALATQRVPAAAASYTTQLVETWTGAVYGARAPASGVVQALCAEFTALDRKAAA
jgi:uncharacterized protein DUF4129